MFKLHTDDDDGSGFSSRTHIYPSHQYHRYPVLCLYDQPYNLFIRNYTHLNGDDDEDCWGTFRATCRIVGRELCGRERKRNEKKKGR